MTISSTTNRVSFAGNGSTTVFSFPYYFLANADLVVILRVNATGVETVKTLTTHYTLTGAGVPAGGSVTMLTAPATGETLVVYRSPAATQDLDLVENDPMPAEEIEERFDKLTMIAQRLQDRLDRAVVLPDGFSPTFSGILPGDLDDAGDKVPLINSAGTGFAAASTWPSADDIADAEENATSATASAAAALASQVAAAASEANAAAAVASAFYRDVLYRTFADSPITLTSADNGKLFVFDSSGGAIAVTLPEISALTPPYNIAALLKTAGNTVTFTRAGTDTIMGATTKALSAANTGFQLVADTGASPDDWSAMDFGTVADGSVTRAKLATGAVAKRTVNAKTANYTATTSDDIIPCDATSGVITITLPAASGNSGVVLEIIKTDSTLNRVDIDGADFINGSTPKSLRTQHEGIRIFCNGTTWRILVRNIPKTVVEYTPTFTGFGTVSAVEMYSHRDGEFLVIEGIFTSGTATAVEGRMTLGFNGTDGGLTSKTLDSIRHAGHFFVGNSAAVHGGTTLVGSGLAYINFSAEGVFGGNVTGALTAANGSSSISNSTKMSLYARVPISGWEA